MHLPGKRKTGNLRVVRAQSKCVRHRFLGLFLAIIPAYNHKKDRKATVRDTGGRSMGSHFHFPKLKRSTLYSEVVGVQLVRKGTMK